MFAGTASRLRELPGHQAPELTRGERLRIAMVCGAAQWLLLLTIQTGDLFGYLLPPAARNLSSYFLLAATLPFLQTQNILVATIFTGLTYCGTRKRVTSWAVFLLSCAESLALLVDQVYYKVFLDHFHLGMIEGGQQFNPVIILGSFAKEVDPIFFCSTAVAVAGSIWFARAITNAPRHPLRMRRILVIGAIIAIAGIPEYSSPSYGHVNVHPVLALVSELQRRSVAEILAGRARTESPPPLRGFDRSVDTDSRLAAFLAAGNTRVPQPNVVLIVMESVGAVDLLDPEGLPSEKFAPNLARLARSGVVFPSIYTTFPGTTRSLVSLHTGGRQFTSGYLDELEPQFTAPLLARRLRGLGYATSLFSTERLDGEGTDVFLEKAGYQKFYDFSRDSFENRRKYELSSWGGREEHTLGLMENWIGNGGEVSQPFYLEYMTGATHHPYNVPAEYHGPVKSGDRRSDYLNALSYSDHAIGSLLDFLERRGLLRNTVVAVTGDHGEAFGDLHSNNFLHKNFIYEENVREFLLLWDGQTAARKLTANGVVSSRVGKNGDIMPTLLALLDEPAADVPGRNLLSERFESQPVYFHKIAASEMMGLRDGRWKFIDEIRSRHAELYDLAADPAEQRNLADANPDRVTKYRSLCEQWYLASEREFVSFLGSPPARNPRRGVPGTLSGARTLSVGYWDRNTGPSSFVPARSVRPGQHVAVWTKWSGDPDPAAIYEWMSPSGQMFVSRPLLTGEPNVTYSPLQGQDDLETGAWLVRLRVTGGFRLEDHFTVDSVARAGL
jgi:arylsulfatase A-like enzyme